MITPQNTIQSIDQNPLAEPSPYAVSTLVTGACQTSVPSSTVTIAPMITACQAESLNTASSSNSTTTGTSATRVLPSTLCTGIQDLIEHDIASGPTLDEKGCGAGHIVRRSTEPCQD